MTLGNSTFQIEDAEFCTTRKVRILRNRRAILWLALPVSWAIPALLLTDARTSQKSKPLGLHCLRLRALHDSLWYESCLGFSPSSPRSQSSCRALFTELHDEHQEENPCTAT